MSNTKFAIVEKKFEYKNHECICVFNRLGFRCGYVSVKENKEFTHYDIDCHCGLTYNGELPPEYEPKHKYYIGFDCGHICDKQDIDQAYAYGLITLQEHLYQKTFLRNFDGKIRNLEYVENQCKKIVEQLEKGA